MRAEAPLLELAAGILAGSPGVPETLDRVAAAARRALGADRASCYVLDPRGRVAMAHTTETHAARRTLIHDAVGRDMPIARVIRPRASPILAVADAGRSRLVPRLLAERLGVGALMAVRLIHPDDDPGPEVELGWLFLSWRSPRRFSPADRRLAVTFALHAAHALSNARLREDARAAAERLRRSEAHLVEAQRMTSLGSWSWEIATGHIEWSAEIFRLCGLTETTEPSADAFVEAVHPDDRERFQRACDTSAEESTPLDVSYRVVLPDGEIRTVQAHGEGVAHDEAGRATWFAGALQDVTERVTQENLLRESEERNRRLAAEQAALRRVATAVAAGATPEAIFGQVAAEVGSLLDVRAGVVWRFEGDRSVAVGSWGHRRSQVGVAFLLAGDGAVPLAWRTGKAATVHYPSLAETDPTAARVRPQGYRSGVAAPIAIDGRPWGGRFSPRPPRSASSRTRRSAASSGSPTSSAWPSRTPRPGASSSPARRPIP